MVAVILCAAVVGWAIAQGWMSGNHALVAAPTPNPMHEQAGIAITPKPSATFTPTPTLTPAAFARVAATEAPAIPQPTPQAPPPPPTSTPTVALPPPPPPPTSCVGVPPFPPTQLPAGYACTEISAGAPGETAGFNGQLEGSVAELENYYRSTLGLGPLAEDLRLDQAAKATAKQLVEAGWIGTNYLPDHIGPDGRDLGQRLADVGLVEGQNLYWSAENYYWGTKGANACRIFSELSEYHRRDIAADCLYGAPKGPYYGIGCYFTYSPQL